MAIATMFPVIVGDVVWPALYLVDRLATWWAVGIGFAIENLVLLRLLHFTKCRSLWVTSIMNGLSAFVGWHVLVWWGWYWEMAMWNYRREHYGFGTFNSLAWAETCILACLASTLIEWPVVLIATPTQPYKSTMHWLLLANIASVGVAFASLYVAYPLQVHIVPDYVFRWLW
jgi:hypothetical protein